MNSPAETLKLTITTEYIGAILETLADEMEGREKIAAQIMVERYRQDRQWGGPAHDDEHNGWDWGRYITKQIRMAEVHLHALPGTEIDGTWRDRMIKIAALAFAAIESHDRLMASPTPPKHDLPGEWTT